MKISINTNFFSHTLNIEMLYFIIIHFSSCNKHFSLSVILTVILTAKKVLKTHYYYVSTALNLIDTNPPWWLLYWLATSLVLCLSINHFLQSKRKKNAALHGTLSFSRVWQRGIRKKFHCNSCATNTIRPLGHGRIFVFIPE